MEKEVFWQKLDAIERGNNNYRFGDWLLLDEETECQFIHYENRTKTIATIDINGQWIDVNTSRLIIDTKYKRYD